MCYNVRAMLYDVFGEWCLFELFVPKSGINPAKYCIFLLCFDTDVK